jgi:hypothetical protein
MKRLLLLVLCLLISVFTTARATKPAHTPAPDTKTSLKDATTDEEVTSDDDDSVEIGSSDEGADLNDDDGAYATGDEDSDDDGGDAAGDEDTGDDGGGDADGGGDEGE